MKELSDVATSVVGYTDGACTGNPGPMGIGGVLRDQNNALIAQFSSAVGVGTNNEAEYLACLRALELAREHGASCIVIKVDSQLLAKQVSGEYAVRAKNIRPLFQKVQQALASFLGGARVEWIRREQNKEADALASAAIRTL